MKGKPVFVVWASFSPRARALAAELNGQVCFLYETRLAGGNYWLKPLRWLVQAWKTWQLLERERPAIALVQAPPVFAPLVVSIWCLLRSHLPPSRPKIRYIIDAHTGTFHYSTWRWSLPLFRMLARNALATLVTDQAALSMLQQWRARGFLLIDGLPCLSPPVGDIGSQGEIRVAVISILSASEPIEEVFMAARLLPHVTFYLTGDANRLSPLLLGQRPANIILTGFLHGGNYTALLKNVHGLVVLTKQTHDLSCGAYEALIVEKPAVVSDGPEMRRFFSRGFIHVDNAPETIARGIQQMLDSQSVLTNEVITTRSELVARRQPVFEELTALLKQEKIHLPPSPASLQDTRPSKGGLQV